MGATRELTRGIYEKDTGSKVYWIRYVDVDGQLHREKAGSLSNAKKLLHVRHTDKLKGKLPEINFARKFVSFSELIDDAINHMKSENAPYVVHDFELKMDHVRPAFGKREVKSITRQELIDWLDARSKKRGWKESTYNRWRAALSLIFRVGTTNEKTNRNPLSGVRRKHEANDRVRYLSLDEEKKLVAAITARYPEYVAIFALSANTAMRMSEQLRSRVGDFNPEIEMLAVHQQKDRNQAKVRYVPLAPMGQWAYERLAKGKKRGDLLCPNTLGRKMSDVTYWFKPCLLDAGIDDYHWHDNRHTACSRWVMGGVPLAAVAKYAGHSTIQMTMRYSHLVPDVNKKAVETMANFYRQSGLYGAVNGTNSGIKTDTGTDTRHSHEFSITSD